MDSRFAVLAIGGNSLIKNKNRIALSWQYEALQETSKYIADLIGEGLSITSLPNCPQRPRQPRPEQSSVKPFPLPPLLPSE